MSTVAGAEDADAGAEDAGEDDHGGHTCRSLVVAVERDGARAEMRAGRDFNLSRWDPVEQNAFLATKAVVLKMDAFLRRIGDGGDVFGRRSRGV